MIEKMKFDMGGAGAVLGAARAVAELAPAVETHFIIAACENMVRALEKRLRDHTLHTCASLSLSLSLSLTQLLCVCAYR